MPLDRPWEVRLAEQIQRQKDDREAAKQASPTEFEEVTIEEFDVAHPYGMNQFVLREGDAIESGVAIDGTKVLMFRRVAPVETFEFYQVVYTRRCTRRVKRPVQGYVPDSAKNPRT